MIRFVTWKLVLAFSLAMTVTATADPVHVTGGAIAGTASSDGAVRIYKGIPFAAPPTGKLRWRPPQPLEPWSGELRADQFKPICMELDQPANKSLFTTLFFTPQAPKSEDCLYLNVWTSAAPDAHAPVVVWIPGGGFRGGSASDPLYDGEKLARQGVVVVSINYRLGRFGFLVHPWLRAESNQHTSGNYGLMDEIAALQWVRQNAAQFGGDPAQVTIFGQSAGGQSVNYLVVSPLAKGLFVRAIADSGSAFTPKRYGSFIGRTPESLADAEKSGQQLSEELGAKSIDDLRSKSADEIMNAPLANRYEGAWPNLDGYVLPDRVESIFARGAQADVPTIVGSNANDGSLFPSLHSLAAFRKDAEAQFGADAETYLKLYPAHDDQTATAASQDERSDTTGWAAWNWVRAQSATGKAPVYYYYFARKPPAPPEEKFAEGPGANAGVYHGAELAYVFGNFYPFGWKWSDDDRDYSRRVQAYWVNFIKTGNPNGPGLPNWPAFNPQQPEVMTFDSDIKPGPVTKKRFYDFWDEYVRKLDAK
jgi:para-nitrobenzyl esterase